jgi:hypothetical protein
MGNIRGEKQMKTSLGIGLISFMLLFGGCSTTTTPEQGQPGAQGAAGQPGQPGQAAPSSEQVAESTTIAPPALPVYEQPVIPGPGYLWTPGYWAWSHDDGDYYWVPGTWVQPPEPEVLWTPGYWAWDGNAFIWNNGYWGPQVGYYGGVNYGFGYTGGGYEGGHWDHGAFFYNRAVNNISNVPSITNVYNQTVVNNVTVNNVSYNGGNGGRTAQPTAAQRTGADGRHIPPTSEQTQHQHAASTNRALLASANHGKPPIAATSKPAVFSGVGVVAAKAAAPYAPRPQAAQPKSEPRPQAVQPRSEPHPQAVQAKSEPRPQGAPPKSSPPPKSAPPPSGEKPKEEHEPPH